MQSQQRKRDVEDYNAVKTPRARGALHTEADETLLGSSLAGRPEQQQQQQQQQHSVRLLAADMRRLLDRLTARVSCSEDVPDGRQRTERWCPEESANWLSQLFFVYANSLVRLGARKHLEQADLWDTAHRDAPQCLWTSFERHLHATATAASPQGLVWKALCREHWRVFAATGALKVLHDCIMFSQPYILELLLHHLSTIRGRWLALGLAGALFGAALLEALTVNIYFHALFRMSLHTKTQLLEMIYRKSLKVSSAVKATLGVGPIVNLQSNDAAKLWTMPTYLHMVWNGPFQIIVVMAMLIRVLTVWPALAGLGVTIAIIPTTMLLGKLLTSARRESMAAADQRIKLMTEVITGIKAIKLYAWESPYLSRITELREAELRAIRKTQMLSMINSSIFNVGPVFVGLAAFGTYAALGHPLTAAVAFPSLALFNLLRFPIVMIPQQIMNLIAATVGIARIQRFMDSEDMAGVMRIELPNSTSATGSSSSSSKHTDTGHPSSTSGSPAASSTAPANGLARPPTSNSSGSGSPSHSGLQTLSAGDPSSNGSGSVPAVQISSGSFAWDAGSQPVLRDVSLRVPCGALVIVVGPVGSGKSSLLSAVLGEMVAVGQQQQQQQQQLGCSPVTVLGSVAYTAQDPWIQNATLRSNVLMGQLFDAGRYQRAIHAACLEKDLEMLPAGDASEIGEKGINLSGGQKHRVALARAVYAAADLYMLDDPLSAVDVHVGRHIFETCICGELAGRTRLLVTHQVQYLPRADLVVVMLEGCIVHTGTYEQLLAQGVDLAAFVPLKTQQQDTEDTKAERSKNHSDKQQQQQLVGPPTSPKAVAAGSPAAAGASTSGSRLSANSSSGNRGGIMSAKSFSGTVVELPPFLAVSGGSFASHKPFKQGLRGQDVAAAAAAAAVAAADAAHSGSAAGPAGAPGPGSGGFGSAASFALYGSSRPQLEAIVDPEGREEAEEQQQHDEAAAAAGEIATPFGAAPVSEDAVAVAVAVADVLQHDSAHSTDDDEVAEAAALVVAKPLPGTAAHSGKLQHCSQEEQQKPDSSAHGDQQGKDSAASGSEEGSRRGRLIKAEERARGQVRRSMYMAYLTAMGPLLLLPIAVTLGALVERGLQVFQNYVLSAWSNATSRAQTASAEPLSGHSEQFYLMLYFVLGLGSVAVVLGRSALLVVGSVAASRQLHERLLTKMLRLPMSFYDAQPTGRLINRFTKDTEALDIQMAAAVNSALTCLVGALLSVVVVVVVSPYTILALIPLALLYYRVQCLYIATSRELKRLDALAFSPIFQHYGESLAGLATIRAFGRQQLFIDTNRAHIEQSNRAWWPIQLLNRWLSIRLELTGAVVVFISAVAVSVLVPRNAGLAGLALTSALNLTGTLAWMVRQTTELEVNMNSVERLVEYHNEPEEKAAITHPRPPPSWPQAGAIQAVQLLVRYRPQLPPVLKGLSFSIGPSEKVGICGRTGCGKSTLMMVLFRMVEPCGGTILIDGLNMCDVGLTDLRSRLSLVPQDPVIFSGTVRSNLDPFGQARGDAAIWQALRQAGIDGPVKSLGAGLDSTIQESGNNLSSGQRQLLCMARALLRSSRILVLDEATSNVDHASDALIQATIRRAFSHCTVLTIAHRLHTIADADRVMVLDQGELREFDAPSRLLSRPGGVFRSLMEEASRQHRAAPTAD